MADYPNRSDLRNPATRKVAFTGQTYGEGAAQARAQQAVSPGSAPSDVQAQRMAPRPRPGAVNLTGPSQRPDEPITAGAPFGSGPGPMTAGVQPRIIPYDDVLITLQLLNQMYPSEALQQLLERYTTDGAR